jgi:hypothetical protein
MVLSLSNLWGKHRSYRPRIGISQLQRDRGIDHPELPSGTVAIAFDRSRESQVIGNLSLTWTRISLNDGQAFVLLTISTPDQHLLGFNLCNLDFRAIEGPLYHAILTSTSGSRLHAALQAIVTDYQLPCDPQVASLHFFGPISLNGTIFSTYPISVTCDILMPLPDCLWVFIILISLTFGLQGLTLHDFRDKNDSFTNTITWSNMCFVFLLGDIWLLVDFMSMPFLSFDKFDVGEWMAYCMTFLFLIMACRLNPLTLWQQLSDCPALNHHGNVKIAISISAVFLLSECTSVGKFILFPFFSPVFASIASSSELFWPDHFFFRLSSASMIVSRAFLNPKFRHWIVVILVISLFIQACWLLWAQAMHNIGVVENCQSDAATRKSTLQEKFVQSAMSLSGKTHLKRRADTTSMPCASRNGSNTVCST